MDSNTGIFIIFISVLIMAVSLYFSAKKDAEDDGSRVKLIMLIITILAVVLIVRAIVKKDIKEYKLIKEEVSTEELESKIDSLKVELSKCDEMLKITEDQLNKLTSK